MLGFYPLSTFPIADLETVQFLRPPVQDLQKTAYVLSENRTEIVSGSRDKKR
jgi:hypothetical protein